MSVNGSLSGITFAGLSTGIDTDGIVGRLMQLESIPIQRLQFRQQTIQQKQGIYGEFKSLVQRLSTAAGALNSEFAFNPVKAQSSDTAIATISGSASASAGSYSLQVTQLAQAHKIATSAPADTTTALSLSGSFVINGKAVTVEAADSLRAIAIKVNSLGAGVTASLIDGGAGAAYLTFSSNSTGAAAKLQTADISGGVLETLGALSGAPSIRSAIPNGVASFGFSGSTEAISTMLGAPSMAGGTIQINGQPIAIAASDSLQTIADAINAAGAGVSATVASSTVNGSTTYRLELTGDPMALVDDANLLTGLGILQQPYGNQLVQAKDAAYSLDGLELSSSSNTVTSAIPGATLTLLKGTTATPGVATLSLSRDDGAIKEKVKAYMTAYNEVVGFIRSNTKFDKESFQSGPLFGDSTAQQIESSMFDLVFGSVPGLTPPHTNLTAIGFGVDSDNKLTLNEATFDKALASDPTAISNLFRAKGVGSSSTITYVSSTSKTITSGAGAYSVEITKVATRGTYAGELAQTQASTTGETLTFNGSLFAGTAYALNLDVGSTAAAAVAKINADAKLRDLVSASLDEDGKLLITSKRYGVGGNFTVVSNLAAATDNSGLGQASLGTSVPGEDVQGTINGEEATGAGQFLTGKAGNAKTEGLQIQYTGSVTGAVGSIKFTKGIGALVTDLMGTFTDSVNGLLTSRNLTFQSELDSITKDIADMQERLLRKQQELKIKFARMEEAISRIQSQSQRLSALSIKNN